VPFEVAETETKTTTAIEGLTLDLRLDRIDRLSDGSLLVIDYKSGNVSPKSWERPRPDDVQLPLYASFGLDAASAHGGLVFATVCAGEKRSFAGRMVNAKATLLSNLDGRSNLVKQPLSEDDVADWRTYIEKMALAFLAGRAEVDPRDYPKTCERCSLQALCRVQEHPPGADPDESEDEAEAEDA
jgi:RecB family exonuclease